MTEIRTIEHINALFSGLWGLIQRPETVAGYILETATDWRKTRNWWQLFTGLPALAASVFLFATAFLAAFRSASSICS